MDKTKSGSFPPNVYAEVHSYSHEWVRKHHSELERPLMVNYRSPAPEEIPEIASLHKEWFPLNYADSYFDSINKSLRCIIAELDLEPYGYSEDRPIILGVIIYRIEKNSMNSYLNWRFFMKSTFSAYITTIGVIEELRGFGIAKALIGKAIEDIDLYFGNTLYISLHVATYNYEGIPFYEKMGFVRMDTLWGHYYIQGRSYDAYLYIKYINGGLPPGLTLENVGKAIKSIITLPLSLRSLIY